jgi:hypothetical protein
VKATVQLEKMELKYFEPVAKRYNVELSGGFLSAKGNVGYAPKVQNITLEDLTVEEVNVQYVHTAATAAKEERRAQKVKGAAREAANKPGMLIKIDRMRLARSNFAYVHQDAAPPYRVFLSDTEIRLRNLGNQSSGGNGELDLRGLFMGTGETIAKATFRPKEKTADLNLDLRIQQTEAKGMNNLLKAYGGFDVAGGQFSVFSEIRIAGDRISGYVKPLFANLDVYHPQQEKGKPLRNKAYEGVVGGASKILENRPRDQIATKIDLSGPVEDPDTHMAKTVVRLVQNAFFKAILPGFERGEGPPP